MTSLHVQPDADQSARAAASFVAARASECVRSRGRFTIGLSGGSTPRRLYRELATPLYASTMPWEQWHVFWGDERCVPPDHEDSNYRVAKEALLDHVPIPAANVYRIRGEADPGQAAAEYEELLRVIFKSQAASLDLVFLGMGEDGHTASLFPGSSALDEDQRLVVSTWVSQLQAYRVTFTLPLINQAHTVAFLVEGRSKADRVKQVLEAGTGDSPIPAAQVSLMSGDVHWFLDAPAASLLAQWAP